MLTATLILPVLFGFQDPGAAKAPAAQDTAKSGTPEAVFQETEKTIKAMPRLRNREEMQARQKEVSELVKKAIEDNGKLFEQGEGVFWKAKLQALNPTGRSSAVSAFRSIAENAKSDKKLANRSFAEAFLLLAGDKNDKDTAEELLAKIDRNALDAETKKRVKRSDAMMHADENREALTGKALPPIPISKTLNATGNFDVNKAQGKVLVLDWWATWCPPCRAVIPELVEMQKAHPNDLQVVGITTYYGNGMDFDENAKLPHGGKSVRDLDKDAEIKVNENFIKAFSVNYPIQFTEREIGLDEFGIMGIPTVFVVGKDGKIVGHVVGGGEEAKAKLEDLVTKALGGAAATDASAPKKAEKAEKTDKAEKKEEKKEPNGKK